MRARRRITHSFNSLAVDTANGTVYCVKGGEIHTLDLMTGTLSEGITLIDRFRAAATAAISWMAGSLRLRITRAIRCARSIPASRASARRKISSQSWGGSNGTRLIIPLPMRTATFPSCIPTSIRNGWRAWIQDMMNRDCDQSTCIRNASGNARSAIYERGYFLRHFTASEKLMQFASTIQPEFLEQLCVNGKFSVLPLNGYFYLPFVNRKAMEKAGISAEEIPTELGGFHQLAAHVGGSSSQRNVGV